MGAKNILAELEALGAVGQSPVSVKSEAPLKVVTVEKVEVPAAIPDKRGPLMLEQLENALSALEVLNQGLHSLYNSIAMIRDVWVETVPEEPQDAAEAFDVAESVPVDVSVDVDVEDEAEPLELIPRVPVMLPSPRQADSLIADAPAAEGKGRNAIEDALFQLKEAEGLSIPTMEDDDEALREESGA